MSNEAKLLEETEAKLFGMTYRTMKVTHWSRQKELSLLEEKLETPKLKSENKIKEYEIGIESIKNELEIKLERIARLRVDMKKKQE